MSESKSLAVVTGGSRGIGLGIAKALAAEGFAVGITGRRDRSDVSEAIEQLEAATGHDVFYFAGDLGRVDVRHALIDQLRGEFPALGCWVNNAGIGVKQRVDLLDVDEEAFDFVFNVNMKAGHFLARLAAKWMLDSRTDSHQSIVNITSVSAEMVSLNRAEYCVAKAALRMSTQLFATRLAPENIGVYEVAPGVIETDMTAGVKEKYDAQIAAGLIPEMRWGSPADVGAAVAACAAGRLPYSTGTCLRIDGGMTIPRL